MDPHPNVARMGQYLMAWTEPDPGGVLALCAPDVVMHVGGDHSMTGTYRGHDGTAVLHGKMRQVSDENVVFSLDDILADDGYAMAIMSLSLGEGDHQLRNTTMGAIKFNADGLVTEAWYLPNDQQAENEFMR